MSEPTLEALIRREGPWLGGAERWLKTLAAIRALKDAANAS